ncbi:eukaryotic peptide chain release factor GTP-binding subunit ERF3A-like [Eriocheir sinensis]|uniref:eukaryotic peptide chain release factor GTP-binding subunit ERF3A-like n=1 Tax=Eriocheir sinensis TaxID=95602 RepID=UPI0021CA1035|nr:eukaryotic peptide chain release factor GTP-binding subunit ERF3A-like [Eriocheir sinensis]
MADNTSAPDCWEAAADDSMASLPSSLSTLNVNAPVFVPNVNAPEFVPSFMKEEAGQTQPAAPDPPPEPSTNTPEDPAATNLDGDVPADSWEEAADAATPSPNRETPPTPPTPGTPDEDDDEDSDEIKKPKKKPLDEDDSAPKKEPVNVIFIGHVDAGKSTIGGQIMYLTGMVEKRTLEKYEREAKEKNRETWYLSWALDTNLEERDKGKTVEVGRAYFETDQKHFTILDAPGHKSFVPNMIGGACQADLAVLVISARKGEFETGFERGGQTREHAMLAKTAGVKHLIVLINKMDDSTVLWSEKRYNECKEKLVPYLKKVGFNPSKDIMFMPCSGLTGANLREPIDESVCSWFKGPAFIPYINNLPPLNRNISGPFMMPIVDRYNDRGTIVMGKVESGCCKKGDNIVVMPNKTPVTVDMLWRDEDETGTVNCGENVKVKLRGVEEADVAPGFVLCDPNNPCKTGRIFDAQVVILEHKSIICAGYSAVCHIHSVAEEVTVKLLLCTLDKKSGDKSQMRPRFVKQDQIAIMRFETSGVICMEAFKDHPQLGRFTLRDEGKTIAIGKVLKVLE